MLASIASIFEDTDLCPEKLLCKPQQHAEYSSWSTARFTILCFGERHRIHVLFFYYVIGKFYKHIIFSAHTYTIHITFVQTFTQYC
jgi:hypothetical protein